MAKTSTASRSNPNSAVDEFVAAATRQAKAEGIAVSTLSLALLNDGKDLARLANGGDIGTRKLERARALLAQRQAQAPRHDDGRYHPPRVKPKTPR